MKKILLILLFLLCAGSASAQWNKTVVDNGIISNDTIYLQSFSFQNYLSDGDTALCHIYGYMSSDSEEFAYCVYHTGANIFKIGSVLRNYYGTTANVSFPSDTGVAYVTVQYWYNYYDLLIRDTTVGTGTVTSVALVSPSEITVTGSPIVTSGTFTQTWANQTTNKVFASPNGSTGTPTFRALVSADLPALPSYRDTLHIGDTIKGSTNFRPLAVDSLHRLGEISNLGNTNKVLAGNGTSDFPSWKTLSSLNAVITNPTSAGMNWIRPTVVGNIEPLALQTSGVLSTADAFAVWTWNNKRLFSIDTGLFADWNLSFRFNGPDNAIGLLHPDSSQINYGLTGEVLTSQGPGVTPLWRSSTALITGTAYRLFFANSSGNLAQVALPAANNMVLQGGTATNPSWTNTLALGIGGGTYEGIVNLYGLTSGNIQLKVPNVVSTYNFTFPNSGGTNGYALTTNGSGTTSFSILGEIGGGTGKSTYATGDILYASAPNTLSKLPIGTTGQGLTVSGGVPAWGAPAVTFSSTTVDLATSTGQQIKDSVTGNILVSVTSKPATRTFEYIVRAADLPTNGIVESWFAYITIGGKNNDGSTRTINWRLNVNGTDKGAGDNSIAIPIATPWWYASGIYQAAAVAVGDTIGFKFWASVANQIDFRYVTIYFLPRLLTGGTGLLSGISTSSLCKSNIAGANAGVTYTTTNVGTTPQFYDVTIAGQTGGVLAGLVWMIGAGHRMTQFNSLSDANNPFSAVDASSKLLGLGSTSLLWRYLYWYH